MNATSILNDLGIAKLAEAGDIAVHSPINGELIGRVASASVADAQAALARAQTAFTAWRNVPAPRRGELVRLLGEKLRERKQALGALVTLEAGKILQEGLGEERLAGQGGQRGLLRRLPDDAVAADEGERRIP